MTERQRQEREVLRLRNAARRVLARELARQVGSQDAQEAVLEDCGPDPALRAGGAHDRLKAAREARRGWQGPKPEPARVVFGGVVKRGERPEEVV